MIACGRDAPERRVFAAIPQCVLAARSSARGGTGGRLALLAGKGAKAQKIGLKSKRGARVWLQIVGAASQIAVEVTAAATQDVQGETEPRAS